MVTVYLGLGANLGSPTDQLNAAVNAFQEDARFDNIRVSTYITSQPVDCPAGSPDYTNAVMYCETALSPHDVLLFCQRLETQAGRDPHRLQGKNLSRTLDIDILFYGDHVIEKPNLVIPHPRLHTRVFVLKPLCELHSALVHPILNKSVEALLQSQLN